MGRKYVNSKICPNWKSVRLDSFAKYGMKLTRVLLLVIANGQLLWHPGYVYEAYSHDLWVVNNNNIYYTFWPYHVLNHHCIHSYWRHLHLRQLPPTLYIKPQWNLFACLFVRNWLRNWPRLQRLNLACVWKMFCCFTCSNS